MGIFDKIKKGVENAVGRSVERGVSSAVEKAVAPKIEQAAGDLADKAVKNAASANAESAAVDNGAMQGGQNAAMQSESPEATQNAGALGGLFSQMAAGMQGFANEAAKNMKICAACGEGASADNHFCPSCGAKLPEQTVSQGAVCQTCGKQNDIGKKYCSGCGTKLPAAEAEEAAAKARDEKEMAKWDELLSQYPKWNLGGSDFQIEHGGNDENGRPYYFFSARGTNMQALFAYRNVLKQHGFTPAGQNPSEDMLYKKINGECFCFESCEPFCSDEGCLTVSFGMREPRGGFDYKKPEKKESKGLFGLFRK